MNRAYDFIYVVQRDSRLHEQIKRILAENRNDILDIQGWHLQFDGRKREVSIGNNGTDEYLNGGKFIPTIMAYEDLKYCIGKTFTYNISTVADNQIFIATCNKIETEMEGIKKGKRIIDVDGSILQLYEKDGKEICVNNDYEVDAVYVESDIAIDLLDQLIEDKKSDAEEVDEDEIN